MTGLGPSISAFRAAVADSTTLIVWRRLIHEPTPTSIIHTSTHKARSTIACPLAMHPHSIQTTHVFSPGLPCAHELRFAVSTNTRCGCAPYASCIYLHTTSSTPVSDCTHHVQSPNQNLRWLDSPRIVACPLFPHMLDPPLAGSRFMVRPCHCVPADKVLTEFSIVPWIAVCYMLSSLPSVAGSAPHEKSIILALP